MIAAGEPMGSPGAIRVLVVDDDEDDFVLMRRTLGAATGKYVLDWVDDFEAGRNEIGRNAHDVYLVDFRLGPHSGLTLVREALADRRELAFVVVTGVGSRNTDLQALDAGAAAYLEKQELTPTVLERSLRYAMERTRLLSGLIEVQEGLRREAIHDDLTGLFNRRHFMERITSEMEEARRYRYPLTLALCDLDDFKGINDRNGHPTGDEALCRFAQAVQTDLRSEDLAARIGGDEFAVLFSHTSPARARICFDRIRNRLLYQVDTQLNLRVVFSCGICALNQTHETAEQLIADADHALYRAKSVGGNRTILFGRRTSTRLRQV
ncbi:MAG: GGDEF domain-containing response regulator [Myxococcales bacterium]|nr:GGDEF domain-containing response regulator [Myxococcales bacterium]